MGLSLNNLKFPTPKLAAQLLVGFSTITLGVGFAHSAIASDIGVLRIQNQSNATQTFIVIDDYFRCMDFPLPKADTTTESTTKGDRTKFSVPANGFKDVKFARDGRCDPEGRFLLMGLDRNSGLAMGNAIALETNSEAKLSRIWEAESPNPHVLGLTAGGKDYNSGHLLYTLNTNFPGYSVSTPKGSWVFACGGGQQCTQTFSSSLDVENSSEKTSASEKTTAFSATVSAGFEFAGASGGAELTSSTESTTSEALAIAKSSSVGIVSECETETDMTTYQIYNVWQWQMEAQVGRDRVAVKTCQVTCTPTGEPPSFLPGSEKAIKACLIERDTEEAALALGAIKADADHARMAKLAAQEKAATTATLAAARATSCVTFYSEPYGKGTAATLCGADDNWADYTNLGTPGTNDLHYAVQSFMCKPGVGYVQFMDGNKTPMPRHNESCKGGNEWVHPNVWVKANATGAGLRAAPAKCCGE
jgi:hypothetical protein